MHFDVETFLRSLPNSGGNLTPYKNDIEIIFKQIEKIRGQTPQDPKQDLSYYFLRKCANSFYSIIVLLAHGACYDALAITRTMFECLLSTKHASAQAAPEALFDEFLWIENYEWRRRTKEQELAGVSINRERVQEMEKRYGLCKDHLNNKGQWYGESIAKMAKDCELDFEYNFLYRLACKHAHPSAIGKRGESKNGYQGGWYPQYDQLVFTLTVATYFMVETICVYSKGFNIELEGRISELEAKNRECIKQLVPRS